MTNSNFSPEIRAEIAMINHAAELDIENHKRLNTTRIGYRLGGLMGLGIASGALLIISALCIVALAATTPARGGTSLTSALLCFAPAALIPVAAFAFLKARYAMKALGYGLIALVLAGVSVRVLILLQELAVGVLR